MEAMWPLDGSSLSPHLLLSAYGAETSICFGQRTPATTQASIFSFLGLLLLLHGIFLSLPHFLYLKPTLFLSLSLSLSP